MLDVRRILCTTDYSECADAALPIAARLADMFGAELHLLHVVELHEDDPETKGLAQLHERARSVTLHDGSVLPSQGGIMTVAPAILNYTETHNIDLVVLASHGRRGLRRFLLGSVAEEVVQRSYCPVLTARQPPAELELGFPQRILVPADLSDHSLGAIAHAKELAAVGGASLQLLHIVELPVIPAHYDALPLSSSFDNGAAVKEARKALEGLYEEAEGPEGSFSVHVKIGTAVDGILDFAKEESSELLVLASHGLTGLNHLLLGSVAEKIVRRSTCPVLTIKSFGKSLLR